MTFTQVPPIRPALAGTTVTMGAAAASGDAVRPGSFLLITNGSGSPITVTLTVGRTYKGYALTAPTVSVAAAATMLIGPIPSDPHQQLQGTDAGWCEISYSSVTSVTRASITTS